MIFTWEKERNCCKCRTQMRPSHSNGSTEANGARSVVVVTVAKVGMENLKFNRWQLIWPKCSDEAPPHIVSSCAVCPLCSSSWVSLPTKCPSHVHLYQRVCVCVCVWSTNVARSTFGNCRCRCRWSRKIEKLTSMKSAIKVGHKCVIRDPSQKA